MVTAAAGLAQTGGFLIEPAAGSRFELRVYKTGLLSGKKHLFVFDRYRGRFDGHQIEFTLEASSIRCLDDWRPATGKIEEIVKVALHEMLDATRHPELRFVSNQITAKGDSTYHATGQLTIRGVSKPVTVTVSRKGNVIEGQAQIRHSDFGLKPQSAALGAIGTKDEMDVTFRLAVAPLN